MIGQDILSGLIQQSANDCITTNSDGSLTFTETYKGPWTTILNLPTTGGFYKDVARNNTLAGQWAHQFSAPSLPTGKAWFLSQVQTSQLEAGDHGEIRLTWYSVSSGGGGSDPDAPDLSTVTISWNCSWAGESKSVLAYCANGGVDLNPDRENASAGNIRMWSEEQDAALKAQNSFQYDGLEYKLTDTELSVGQLYNKDVNPVFHSPVIIKTTSRNVEQLSSIDLNGVDTIMNPQSPFRFEEDWKFIYLGAEVSYTQKSYYSKQLSADKTYYELEMKETWSGHKNPREEFYGENAWKIGEL